MTIQELIVELQHSIDKLGFKKNALVVFDVQDSRSILLRYTGKKKKKNYLLL